MLVPPIAAHWTADAVPDAIGRLRTAVAAFVGDLGASDALQEDVRLAMSEALTNAVVHAYPGAARGCVEARASSQPTSGFVTLRVRDHGIGIRPRTDSPGMGAGIAIMAALAHSIEIAAHAGGGTEVCLTFEVARPRPAG